MRPGALDGCPGRIPSHPISISSFVINFLTLQLHMQKFLL